MKSYLLFLIVLLLAPALASAIAPCHDYAAGGPSPGAIVHEVGEDEAATTTLRLGDRLIVAGARLSYGFLDVLDASDPEAPVELGRMLYTGRAVEAIPFDGDVMMLWYNPSTHTGGLKWVQVSAEGQPAEILDLPIQGEPVGVVRHGEAFFIGVIGYHESNHILVADFTGGSLQYTDQWLVPYAPADIALDGDRVYACGDGYLEIFAADPTHMVLIDSWMGTYPLAGLTVRDRIVYVSTDYLSILMVIDLSLPDSYDIRDSIYLPENCRGAAVEGNTLYMWAEDLHVVDVANLDEVLYLGSVATGSSGEVKVSAEGLWHAAGAAGVELLPVQCEVVGGGLDHSIPGVEAPRAARLTALYPNPFNPRLTIGYEMAEAGVLRLRIADARGRIVEDLSRAVGPGAGEVVWDGTDRSGRALPSGVYFVQMQTGRERDVRKVVLAR